MLPFLLPFLTFPLSPLQSMFTPPPKTLLKSLHRLLDYAQDYVADVRFDYPGARIWAHRGKSGHPLQPRQMRIVNFSCDFSDSASKGS